MLSTVELDTACRVSVVFYAMWPHAEHFHVWIFCFYDTSYWPYRLATFLGDVVFIFMPKIFLPSLWLSPASYFSCDEPVQGANTSTCSCMYNLHLASSIVLEWHCIGTCFAWQSVFYHMCLRHWVILCLRIIPDSSLHLVGYFLSVILFMIHLIYHFFDFMFLYFDSYLSI